MSMDPGPQTPIDPDYLHKFYDGGGWNSGACSPASSASSAGEKRWSPGTMLPEYDPAADVVDQVGVVGPVGLAVIEAARRWRAAVRTDRLAYEALLELGDAVDRLELQQ